MRKLLIPCLLIISCSAFGTTRLVAKTGTDSGNCSVSSCLTISYALGQSSSGDTISVHTGTYYENINASATTNRTLQAYGDGTVILDASKTPTYLGSWSVDSGAIYKATYTGPQNIEQVMVNNPSTGKYEPLAAATMYGDTRNRVNVTVDVADWTTGGGTLSGTTVKANTQGVWFQDLNTGTLYVQLWDGTSPSTRDLFVVMDRVANVASNALTTGANWTVTGISIRGGQNYGIQMGAGATFTNNTVYGNVWTATDFGATSTVTNNEIYYNMLNNWPWSRCWTFEIDQTKYGPVATTTLNAAGSGYTANDIITLVEPQSVAGSGLYDQATWNQTPSGATVKVLTVDGLGAVLTYSIQSTGSHYYVATGLSSTGGTGSGFKVNVTAITSGPNCWRSGGWGGGLLLAQGASEGNGTVATSNTTHHNGGEGLISYNSQGSNTAKSNLSYDNWSMQSYSDAEPYDTWDGNRFYGDDPASHPEWAYMSGGWQADWGNWKKRGRGNGLIVSEEQYGQTGPAQHDFTGKNNVIVGCRYGLGYINEHPEITGAYMLNNTWVNNTIVLPSVNGRTYIGGSEDYVGIHPTTGQCASGTSYGCVANNDNTGNVISNNIVIGQGSHNKAADIGGGASATSAATGLSWTNNDFYVPSNTTDPFRWVDGTHAATEYTCSTVQTIFGTFSSTGTTCGGTSAENPNLNNNTSLLAVPDKELSAASGPAYRTGVAVTGVTTDYLGNLFANPPSMGAFEFGSSTPTSSAIGGSTHIGGSAVLH